VAAIRRRSSWHALLAAVFAIALPCVAFPQEIGNRYYGAIPAHLLLFAMLLIGAMFHDGLAQFLQRIAVAGIFLACLFVVSGGTQRWQSTPARILMIYPGVMLMLVTAYSFWVHNRWYRVVSLLILAGWLMALSERSYRSLRTAIAGIDQIVLGLTCLVLGLAVSLWKLGMPQAWFARWLSPHAISVEPEAKTDDNRPPQEVAK
jgi:hypothetical protein